MEGCVRGVTIRRRRRRKRERTKEQRDKVSTKYQRRKKMGGKPSLTDIPCEFGLSPHFFSSLRDYQTRRDMVRPEDEGGEIW
jgi:hypothetical protein